MSRYLTGGMVVLADDHPGTEAALSAGLEYAVRTVVVAHPGLTQRDGAEIVHPKRAVSIDAAFRQAADEQMPWITMRRDVAGSDSLSQVLEATGRRARKDLPGFAVLFTGPEPRSASRILAVVDRADDHPSGLLALVAVASAQATGAALDVLLIGAPGETVTRPRNVGEAVQISRDKDLYEQAVRRAQESGIAANWIVAEDVADKRSLVLEQVAEGEYDLVIEDLSSVKLGGRLGRGGRIRRALDPDGPAMIVRAVLDDTEVPLVVVLDNVRLGLVPPAVVKGGAGAALALGIMASAAPASSASPADRARVHETVSQTVEAYEDALGQAATMTAPTEVEAAAHAAQQAATESRQTVGQETGAQAGAAAGSERPGQAGEDGEQADAAEESGDIDAQAASAPATVSPADLAPEDVTPDKAPKSDPDSVKVGDDVDSGDVSKTQEKAESAKSDLKAAQKSFDAVQQDALDATAEAQDAAEGARAAADEFSAAEVAYEQVYAETEASVEAATGPLGGSAQDETAAAEQAQGTALLALDEALVAADEALDHYNEAATDAASAHDDLEAAAADVTEVDAAHQRATAKAEATGAAFDESMASSRVSPVPGYAVTTGHGVSGSMWSTGQHTGVDYASPTGTEVVAAASGTVVEVGSAGAYGNRIVVDHGDGYSTTYNHLSAVDVRVGQEVVAGDHLGAVGSTGNSSGAHLHFEVTTGGDGWSGGSFVDPEAWLTGEIG